MTRREQARSLITALLDERRGFLAQILQRADPPAIEQQVAFWTDAVELWMQKNVPDVEEPDALADIVRRLEMLEAAPFAAHQSPCPSCGRLP